MNVQLAAAPVMLLPSKTFLNSCGLSIYKEEDRAEGRAIARAFMESDKETSGSGNNQSSSTGSTSTGASSQSKTK